MAEIRQFAHNGKEIDEAVDKVQNGTVYEAGDNVSISGKVISATDTTYEAGVGIDISNDVLSVDDIPLVVLDTVLTGDLRDWVAVKHLPIKYGNDFYSCDRVVAGSVFYHKFNSTVNSGKATVSASVLLYNGTSHKFTAATTQSIATATSSTEGFVKLGSDTVQLVAANAASETADRTYPVQLNADGQAVVNVPWNLASVVPLSSQSIANFNAALADFFVAALSSGDIVSVDYSGGVSEVDTVIGYLLGGKVVSLQGDVGGTPIYFNISAFAPGTIWFHMAVTHQIISAGVTAYATIDVLASSSEIILTGSAQTYSS